MKNFLLVAGLLVSFGLGASEDRAIELSGVDFTVEQRPTYLPYARLSSFNSGLSDDSSMKIGVVCCCLFVASAIFSGVYAPRVYRFHNTGSNSINVHAGQSSINGGDDDYMVTVKPGKEAKVYVSGKFYHLGATHTWFGVNEEYATNKALQHTYNYDISNDLAWSKHVPNSRRLRGAVEEPAINFTKAESAEIINSASATQERTSQYLRGSNEFDKFKK